MLQGDTTLNDVTTGSVKLNKRPTSTFTRCVQCKVLDSHAVSLSLSLSPSIILFTDPTANPTLQGHWVMFKMHFCEYSATVSLLMIATQQEMSG